MVCVMPICQSDFYRKPISHSTEHNYAMVQAAEASTEQMHVMSGVQAVSAVHQRGNRGQQGQQGRKSRDRLKNPSYFKCKNCSYEHAPMKCPAFGKECHECGRLNHFQNRCKRNNVQKLQRSAESDNEFEGGMLTTVNSVRNKRRAMITLDVGQKTTCQPDSKAIVDCCVLPQNLINEYNYDIVQLNKQMICGNNKFKVTCYRWPNTFPFFYCA